MTGNEVNLNIGGKQFTIKEGVKYDTQNNEGIKKVLTIFDKNHDGKISKEELGLASRYAGGIFGVSEDNKSVVCDREVKDGKNQTTWKFDEDGKLSEVEELLVNKDTGEFVQKVLECYDKDENPVRFESYSHNAEKPNLVVERGIYGNGKTKYERETKEHRYGGISVTHTDYDKDGKVMKWYSNYNYKNYRTLVEDEAGKLYILKENGTVEPLK